MKNFKLIIFTSFIAITLMVCPSIQAAETITPIFRCIDKEDGYRLEVDTIYNREKNIYVYPMKVLDIHGKLIYTSNAESSTIGRETIFSLTGRAINSAGKGTTASLYLVVNKIVPNFEYLLSVLSFDDLIIPVRINFSCQ